MLIPRLKRFAWQGHVLMILLVGGVAAILGLAVLGFPSFLTRWILASANSGDYFVQAREVYLDLGGGLKARNVSVYRKGMPGPPFLETRELRLLYHLFERPRSGHTRIKELRAYDGIIRPLWSSTSLGPNRNPAITAGLSLDNHENKTLREFDLDVALFNFEVLGVWVEQVKSAVRVDHEGVFLSRVSGKVGQELHSGALEGTLAWRNEGQLTGRLITTFDPHALIPICAIYFPEAVGVFGRFSFPANPPRMDFTFEAVTKPALSVTAKGRVQASNYAYLGAVIGFANMNLEYVLGNGTNRLSMAPFSLTMGGRHARGQVDFDFASGMADFQVNSEVNVAAVLRLIGLKEYLMSSWNLEEGARLAAKGRIGYSHPENSKVEAVVEGAKIGYKGLFFNNYSFTYNNHGYTHSVSDFRGNIGGGFASGSAVFVADPAGTNWTAEVKAEIINADTDELLKLVSTNLGWRMGGKIFGNLEVGGIGANLVGQGQLTIRDARVFQSPLAAGLLEKWGGLSRDLDLPDLPTEARFSFELKDNKINSKDLVFEAGSLGLLARGSCGLDGSLDWLLKPVLRSNKNATGRAVISLLSQNRQGGYSLTGTFTKPEWRPLPNLKKE